MLKENMKRAKLISPRTDKKEKAKRIRATVKYVLLAILGLVLFVWGSNTALETRGYKAYGGELFFLGLPLIWALAEKTFEDC